FISTHLREALRALQAIGIIEIRRGIGMFVTESPLNPISKSFDWSVFLKAEQVEKIMEARHILEVGLARVAALHATDEEIEEMSEILDTMSDAFRHHNTRLYEEADIRFHLALASAADNPLLLRFAQILRSALETFIKAVPHTAAGFKYHREVLEAIRKHNPSKAEAAMRRLLSVTEIHLQQAKPGASTPNPNAVLASEAISQR
ncbi:MAG: FCD domain-containing protein, partial [Chloroflexi bacterium]|nr:FCD domain-containing protein [Chloroflexota bacterium]